MKATDKEDFVRKLNKLALNFPKKFVSDDFDMYWRVLMNYRPVDINRAMWWFVENRKPSEFYPTPAEMKAKVLELIPRAEALPEPPTTADDYKWLSLGAAYSWQCISQKVEFTHEGFIDYIRHRLRSSGEREYSDEWIQKMLGKYSEDEDGKKLR